MTVARFRYGLEAAFSHAVALERRAAAACASAVQRAAQAEAGAQRCVRAACIESRISGLACDALERAVKETAFARSELAPLCKRRVAFERHRARCRAAFDHERARREALELVEHERRPGFSPLGFEGPLL